MHKEFFPCGKPSITEEDRQAVADVLSVDSITRSDKVKTFEQAIAAYCKTTEAVAFCNGSSALHALFLSFELKALDRVFLPSLTYVASLSPIIKHRAKIFFIEINPLTGLMDINHLQEALKEPSSRGRKFILPMHYGGLALSTALIEQQIQDDNTYIVEDAAHALGATDPLGDKVGSCLYSEASIFSFHPSKSITTGEGGLITTNNRELAKKLRLIRNNGIQKDPSQWTSTNPPAGYYEIQAFSNNFHLTDFQAALGLSQFNKLDKFIKKRRRLLRLYKLHLEKEPFIRTLTEDQIKNSASHLCTLLLDFDKIGFSKEILMKKLLQNNIQTQVHYPPLHSQPYLKGKFSPYPLPQTELFFKQTLSFPLYYDLSSKDIAYICSTLKSILATKHKI